MSRYALHSLRLRLRRQLPSRHYLSIEEGLPSAIMLLSLMNEDPTEIRQVHAASTNEMEDSHDTAAAVAEQGMPKFHIPRGR